jgi:REP-associated tyrosine transposase
MAAPTRGNTGYSCYLITACTFPKRRLLQSDRMANLIIDIPLHYRQQGKFLLHEFVVMPDHFHLLITPTESLERALQLIKGGFSYRAKKTWGILELSGNRVITIGACGISRSIARFESTST